jgi:hypothetical protein
MCPISVAPDGARFVITHRCEICGKVKRQRTSDNDDMDAIIALSKNDSFIFGV